MDLNLLLHRNRLALERQEAVASDEERRAFRQFARDFAVGAPMERTDARKLTVKSKIVT